MERVVDHVRLVDEIIGILTDSRIAGIAFHEMVEADDHAHKVLGEGCHSVKATPAKLPNHVTPPSMLLSATISV